MNARKIIKRLSVAAGLYLLLCLGFYLLQPLYVFQPAKLPAHFDFSFDVEPAEHMLAVADEIELNLLHFKANGPRTGTVLYFHGNADNLQRWGHYHTDFTSRGYDVWMYDYRGFGKSGGGRGDKVYYEDARKVFDYVQQKYPEEELVLFGRSLGTSIASELATHVSCDSLILFAPFDNLGHLLSMKYPWIWQPLEVQYDFANDNNMALGIAAPIYILHGTIDAVVPYQSSLYLKEHLLAKDKYFLIDGAGHKNMNEFAPYQRRLTEILGSS